jgi:uncharacterized membrane protein
MDIALVVIQFAHVAAGAAWFGASVFANVAVLPYIATQPPARQRDLVGRLILGPEKVLIAAALGAAVTGVVRGVVFGRIESVATLATPYGVVWLASIVIATFVFATGGRVTSPAARRIRDDGGASNADVANLLARVRVGFRIELAGIATILAAMVLLARL